MLIARSYLSPNMAALYKALAECFAQVAGDEVQFAQAEFDAMDDPDMTIGRVDLAFVCGLPLSRLEGRGSLVPLIAPVMEAARYGNKPVYFSDIIARADYPAARLKDLRGATFTFNDLGSQSGYNSMRYAMLERGLTDGFFGKVTQSGAHLKSIPAVLNGEADCAAIDSLVLDQAMRTDPTLRERLKVVESLGPYPNPPVAIHRRYLEQSSAAEWADALIRAIPANVLQEAHIMRYQPVGFADYEVLRAMYDAAQTAGFMTIR